MSNKKIVTALKIIPQLSFRDNADKLFDYIEAQPETNIVVAFDKSTPMSISFAHQYHYRKTKSRKRVSETNLLDYAEKMMHEKHATKQTKDFDFSTWQRVAVKPI